MERQIEKLAQFVADTRWEDIPGPVQRQAKLVLLDTLGVILAGSVRPEAAQLRERLAATAGLQEALSELRPRPEDIERIDIATYRFASVMCNPDPPNYFGSRYSLPHAAAVMAVRGNAGYGAMDDSSLQDSAVVALRHRVHVTEDPAMSAMVPRLKPARATVTLKDGRQSTRARDSHRGDFNQPYSEAELREKFRELAGVVLTPEGVAQVAQSVDRCDEWQSVTELTGQLRRHGRDR